LIDRVPPAVLDGQNTLVAKFIPYGEINRAAGIYNGEMERFRRVSVIRDIF
jgi:hypothetical protein